MKMMAPNMARPMRNPRPLATRNTEERNSVSGTTGSAARRSCQMNRPSSRAPAAARPTMTAEPQGYSVPPHVVTRMSAETPAVSRPAPR